MKSHTKGSDDVSHCVSTRDYSDYVMISRLACFPRKFSVNFHASFRNFPLNDLMPIND